MTTTTTHLVEHWRTLWAYPPADVDHAEVEGRIEAVPPPWDYEELVRHELGFAGSALDIGTGDGEFLRSLEDDLPVEMHATEGCPQHLARARAALGPLDVEVRDYDAAGGGRLPYPDASVDLVLCRHEPYAAAEVARVLRPGGWFLTEQLGSGCGGDLAAVLGGRPGDRDGGLGQLRREAEDAGLVVERAESWAGPVRFGSLDALVVHLRCAARGVSGTDLDRYVDELVALHADGGPVTLTERRCLLVARLPQPEHGRTDPFLYW